eukprot:11205083-Lingulodinium_polyedra.AAC.1
MLDLREEYESRVGNYLEYQGYNLRAMNFPWAMLAGTGGDGNMFVMKGTCRRQLRYKCEAREPTMVVFTRFPS